MPKCIPEERGHLKISWGILIDVTFPQKLTYVLYEVQTMDKFESSNGREENDVFFGL